MRTSHSVIFRARSGHKWEKVNWMHNYEHRNRELEHPVVILGALLALGMLALIASLLGLA